MSDPREVLAEIKQRADESWRAWNPTDPRDHPSESVDGGIRARGLTFESQEDVAPLMAALTAVLDLCDSVSRNAPDALDLADDVEKAITEALER